MYKRQVDWNTIEAKLAPPYSFYTLGAGIVSLKVNHLVEWAKIRITHANVDSDAEVQIRPA